jgi:hypothetical protein
MAAEEDGYFDVAHLFMLGRVTEDVICGLVSVVVGEIVVPFMSICVCRG